MTRQYIPHEEHGIDFTQDCYHVEVKPDHWAVIHADHENEAIEIAEKAGYVVINVERQGHAKAHSPGRS